MSRSEKMHYCFKTNTVAAGAVIFYSYDLYRNGNEEELVAWFSAGGFVLITFPVCLYLIIQHLTHWYMPDVQKYVVRIIWMVPAYSIESWLSLRFREFAMYIETLRECYEAYVIYSFLYYLIALLGDESRLVAILKSKPQERGRHFFPLNRVFSPWDLGRRYLHNCKMGVFQYVLIKNICAIISISLEKMGHFCEGSASLRTGYIYVSIVNALSQLWALYCLSMFYLAFREELKPWSPVGKFLSVKLVIFFTWWQSIMVNVAAAAHIIKGGDEDAGWTVSEIYKGLQDYLICVEMLVAAICYNYTFTYEDYMKPRKRKRALFHNTASDSSACAVCGSSGEQCRHDFLGVEGAYTERNHLLAVTAEEGEHRTMWGGEHVDDADDSEEREREPFLSALLQSSVPDDVMRDIRRVTTGQFFYDNSPHVLTEENGRNSLDVCSAECCDDPITNEPPSLVDTVDQSSYSCQSIGQIVVSRSERRKCFGTSSIKRLDMTAVDLVEMSTLTEGACGVGTVDVESTGEITTT